MTLPKKKFREFVFQLIFAYDFDGKECTEDLLGNSLSRTLEGLDDVRNYVQRIEIKKIELDAQIQNHSSEYSIDRISKVEKNILRLGVYELLFDDEIPPKVTISEAIRICRKFGSPSSGKFVNAILDAIYQHGKIPSNP